jgi:hypothetical protein
MTKLTTIEQQAIQGILDSDFMDGLTGADAVGRDVWTWSANPFADKRTFSGAVSSLAKKGFVRVQQYERNETIICLTGPGWEAFQAATAKAVA